MYMFIDDRDKKMSYQYRQDKNNYDKVSPNI